MNTTFKKLGLLFFFLSLTILLSSHQAKSDSIEGRFCLGFSNPCLSVKFGLLKNISMEGRYAFNKEIKAPSGRIYFNINPKSKAVLFIGAEYGIINFKYKDLKGKGNFMYGFGGLEYFFTKRITFWIDFGSAYTKLKEDEFGLAIDRNELVYNLGINLYFN